MNLKLEFKPAKLIPHYIESKPIDLTKVNFETKKKFPDRFYHASQVEISQSPDKNKNQSPLAPTKLKDTRMFTKVISYFSYLTIELNRSGIERQIGLGVRTGSEFIWQQNRVT